MVKLSSGRGSGYGFKPPRWHIKNIFTSLDSFGLEVPSFNIKGETKINTAMGGLVTTLILICTLAYATVKMIQLAAGENPVIN